MGIASFSGTILENIVIEDNVFDNTDPTKDQDFKGSAIHLNKVDGLLIRRNIILNSSMHFSTSPQEDGAITVHEFLRQPNFLDNVFIQNNVISFDYSQISGTPVTGSTRGIVLAHTGKTTDRFDNVVVEYNLIDNVQKEGIKVFGTSTDAGDDETTHVSNNVIKRTANGIEIDAGIVIIDSTIFDGDVTFGNEGKDEAINYDGGSVTITNTIVTEKLDGITGGPAGITVTCIDLFNTSLSHPTNSAGGTEINVDPMFVSAGTNDYTIGNGSFPAGCAGGSFGLVLEAVVTVDHYNAYEVRSEAVDDGGGKKMNELNIDVTLDDQFGSSLLTVKKAKLLLVPVDKNDEGIVDAVTHLVCYELKNPAGGKVTGVKPNVDVAVVNQFNEEVGDQVMEVKKLKMLCVPSTKELLE